MSIYLSATAIKDYIICPKKIYYRTNFPELAETNKDMDVGTVVHEALEKFWNNKQKALEFATKKSTENNVTAESFYKTTRAIETFFDNPSITGLISNIDLIEHKFKIPLSTDSFLVGKIDRITSSGIIMDWKTTTRTPKSIDKDPQFLCYYFAYKHENKTSPNAVLYVSLIENKIVRLKFNQDTYDQLFKEIIPSMVTKIKKNDLPPIGLFNNSCYNCLFKRACLKNIEEE